MPGPLPDPLFDQLEVGKTYRAHGPADDSRMGPAPRVTITGVTDKGYKTTGKRQAATLIAFGCEGNWILDDPDSVPASNPTMEV